ncbi:DNA ligase D [Sediminibacterium soli]|uniref:DNA ligase D n=1 Tax=Sediminibacterium soli TaxID=2698829 RepID=UPI001379F0B2|nr:DNA ligase D [Sediminibacterium soli]NCI45914.1 DNA ligase D [Sediminibacterium soli]
MSLSLYRKKRSFSKTTEPTGGKANGAGLRFVVQKHDASHLHYDFRLEMEGVLKSWAVPKGPSLDPETKRLAMMVEDHPYDYRNFEGIIPEGNYGAGTVIVWDEGEYKPADPVGTDKRSQEKQMLQELKKKKLKITLHGKKLKGEFALVKTHTGAENAWLLMKVKDKYATDKDITQKDTSVRSKKTIEQMQRSAAKMWKNGKAVKTAQPPPKKRAKKTAAPKAAKTRAGKSRAGKEATDTKALSALLKRCPAAPFPQPFKPMLATRVSEAFDKKDWLYEIKWDGYRAVAYLHKGRVSLYSRNLLSFNSKFAPVVQALEAWKTDAVLDGEIVALDTKGQPSFQLLQNHQNENRQFAYYVFDIVWYQGRDLTDLGLLERKSILETLLPAGDEVIRYSSHVTEKGKAFFDAAVKHGLEGVMAKKADSGYTKNRRSGDWLKIKNDQRLEAIICGFTRPRNSRSYFGAVILGRYQGSKLVYIGHSGSGFTGETLKDMAARFKPLIRKTSPFAEVPKTNMPVTWLKPELVCEVKFTEWTGDQVLRHPIFLGLREDKNAANEKNEKVVKAPITKKKAVAKATRAKSVSPLIDPVEKEQTVKVKGHELKLTNLNKLYWPKEKITKRDLLNYYADIAPYLLPYMKNRPQSLNRHPDGIDRPGFFHKNMPDTAPGWITTFPYSSESDQRTTNYLVCKDEADLLYMASLGCIEMNPWHSRVPDVDHPDWCVIDLDPDTNTFNKVIETANVVNDVLNSIGAKGYCKTSGSTGLHIYVPLGAKYTYEQSRLLAQLVVQLVHRELPTFTSIERSPAKRKGKIYLDYLQNKTTQTIAAPYSLRPKPGAPVSAPLHWEEVKKGLKIKDHTIYNIQDRLKETGDIFKPVLGKAIDIQKVLKKLESLE